MPIRHKEKEAQRSRLCGRWWPVFELWSLRFLTLQDRGSMDSQGRTWPWAQRLHPLLHPGTQEAGSLPL